MKTEELKAKGLTDEQISFVMAENGKDVNAAKKELTDTQAERDMFKKQSEDAQKLLKSFDGVDVEKLKADVETYKKAAEDAEKDYKQRIADRDFEDSLASAIRSQKGLNERAIKALLDVDALKASKNQNEDIKAAIEKLKGEEDSKMLFGADDGSKPKPKPSFTSGTSGNDGGSSKLTRSEIMAIKDTDERRKAIQENLDLFS